MSGPSSYVPGFEGPYRVVQGLDSEPINAAQALEYWRKAVWEYAYESGADPTDGFSWLAFPPPNGKNRSPIFTKVERVKEAS